MWAKLEPSNLLVEVRPIRSVRSVSQLVTFKIRLFEVSSWEKSLVTVVSFCSKIPVDAPNSV